MSFDGFDDELYWNEYQWEAHLDELEEKSERLRKFISSNNQNKDPRWLTLLRENLDENDNSEAFNDAVEAFIEEELLLDEAYFPEDEDDWEDEDDEDIDDDFFFSDLDDDSLFGDDEFDEDDEDDDYEAGEEWKFLSDDFTRSEFGNVNNLPTFINTKELAVDILKWAESIHEQYHNKIYHDFVNDILKTGAKIAGGYSFGFEQDYIGGNIAYNKKALFCANSALSLLQKQKTMPYMSASVYKDFHNRLFELRNEIGIEIQNLRDYFNMGPPD